MQRLVRLLTFIAVLFIGVPFAAAQDHPAFQSVTSLNHRDATVVSKSPERVVLAASDMQLGVELLAGQRAIQALQAVKAQHPERFANMGKYLVEHGYVPTDDVMVARFVRFLPVEARSPGSGPRLHLASSASTSEGVVITQSWDDGSDATWEGSVYVEQYSDGAWTSSEGQMDIATADWEVIWAEAVAGEEPGGGDPFPAVLEEGPSALQQFSFAIAGPSTSLQGSYRPCVFPYAVHPWWQDWAGCVVAASAGCATACALTGPGWPECTGACAAGAFVACALDKLVR